MKRAPPSFHATATPPKTPTLLPPPSRHPAAPHTHAAPPCLCPPLVGVPRIHVQADQPLRSTAVRHRTRRGLSFILPHPSTGRLLHRRPQRIRSLRQASVPLTFPLCLPAMLAFFVQLLLIFVPDELLPVILCHRINAFCTTSMVACYTSPSSSNTKMTPSQIDIVQCTQPAALLAKSVLAAAFSLILLLLSSPCQSVLCVRYSVLDYTA